jgi:hypothetical protein
MESWETFHHKADFKKLTVDEQFQEGSSTLQLWFGGLQRA